MFRGVVSLYDKLRVDLDPRSLLPRVRDPSQGVIEKVGEVSGEEREDDQFADQEMEVDEPQYGHISNIEPLYCCVREGR